MQNLQTDYNLGFHKEEKYVYKSEKGISRRIVEDISWQKNEPEWMRKFRLDSFGKFRDLPMPRWGADLSGINFDDIYYYIKPSHKKANLWSELPPEIKDTYDRIGIPEAEKKYLGGVSAQYESEVVYKSIQKTLSKKGVIFTDMESGLRLYPDIVKKYFGKLVTPGDNKFAALNSAVWSGGSFVYIPKNVKVELPLQAYFRINAANMGQFERTLIIADEGSSVHYIEGCTAPIYSTDSLHAAVVEIYTGSGATVRYTTIQNWSKNVYNLVTKRMRIGEEGTGIWVDGNLGSKATMKYPSLYLAGRGACGDLMSVAYGGGGQHIDAGCKVVHMVPDTSSKIISKSISYDGGRTSYRGMVKVLSQAENSKTKVTCDALIVDEKSRSDTYPTMDIGNNNANIEHEASVSKISEEQLFYLKSRGFDKNQSEAMIVNGFIEPIVRELPMEFAVEFNRLVNIELSGSTG